MRSLIEAAKNHKKLLTALFYLVMAALVVLIARNELKTLSGPVMKEALAGLTGQTTVITIIMGLVAFTATGLYDAFASKHFGIDIPLRTSLKIGWISQAFNNFAGLGGLTGGTIRAKYYQKAGADKSVALNATMCVWAANLVGLFVLLLVTLPFGASYERGLWIVPAVACLYIPLYFFGGNINLSWFKDHFPLRLQNFHQKCEMTVASLVDWAVAAVFFWWCVALFIPDVSLLSAIFVYSTATLAGLLSFIPAGLGAFDVTCVALLTAMGHDSSKLVLAIVIYRVTYYLFPWILATLAWASEAAGLSTSTRKENWVITILWIGVLTSGIALVISVLTPDAYFRIRLLRQVTPRFVYTASGIMTLLVGIMLIILARGIRARVARIYPVCLGLLVLGATASLVKGLNYEEAIYLSIFALLLYSARSAFVNAPLRINWRNVLATGGTIIGIPLAIFIWRVHQSHSIINPYPHHGRNTPLFPIVALYALIVAGIAVSLLFSRGRRLEFTPPTAEDITRFDTFLKTYGGNEYSHLFFLGDKQVFYSHDGTVAMLYRPDNNNLIVLGDPIGREGGFEDAIDEFIAMADEHRMSVAIYELSARHLATCADQGFTFIKIGEDADVDLSTYSNVGNKGKVFRRMRNRMGEKGTHFEMVEPPFTEEFLAEIRDVSDAWLGDRSEMGFSLGFFSPEYFQRAPIAIVRGENRIEGFATVMPSRPGVASVDLMRIRPDAPGGTMDGIFVSLIEWARDNGYDYYNLGMAPMSNTGNTSYSSTKQKAVRYIYNFGNRAYNFKGLRSYKEKFKPQWTSRYLVYKNASVLVSTLLSVLNIIHHPTTAHAIGVPTPEEQPVPNQSDVRVEAPCEAEAQ